MKFLAVMGTVLGAIGYLCLAFKIGSIVGEATEDTGFDYGFYLLTTVGLIALPLAIAAQVLT
jgi:hypothetical protein